MADINDALFNDAWAARAAVLRRTALKYSKGCPHLADDLLQAAAIKAIIYMREAPETVTNAGGLLSLILKNTFLDHIKLRRTKEIGGLDLERCADAASGATPDIHASSAQDIARVARLVGRMKEAQRTTFKYSIVDGLSNAEIADRLNINEVLVRKRLQLVRDKLKRQ